MWRRRVGRVRVAGFRVGYFGGVKRTLAMWLNCAVRDIEGVGGGLVSYCSGEG